MIYLYICISVYLYICISVVSGSWLGLQNKVYESTSCLVKHGWKISRSHGAWKIIDDQSWDWGGYRPPSWEMIQWFGWRAWERTSMKKISVTQFSSPWHKPRILADWVGDHNCWASYNSIAARLRSRLTAKSGAIHFFSREHLRHVSDLMKFELLSNNFHRSHSSINLH